MKFSGSNKRKLVKDAGKKAGKFLGKEISDAALSLLEGLGNWVGLGPKVKDWTSKAMKEFGGIDVESTKDILRKVINYAMTNESVNLDQLQDKINGFSALFPNSNLRGFILEQKDKLQSALKQGKINAAKVQAGLSAAEVKLNELDNYTAGELATKFKDKSQEIKDDINAALANSNQESIDYNAIEEKFK